MCHLCIPDKLLDEGRRHDAFNSVASILQQWEMNTTRIRTCAASSQVPGSNQFLTTLNNNNNNKNRNKVDDDDGGILRIFPFGSWRLGVHCIDADIDILVVGPSEITRHDFFEFFPKFLEQHVDSHLVSSIRTIPTAYVPVIKFNIAGFEIDLIFANVPYSRESMNSFSLLDDAGDNMLACMDRKSVVSLNGARVTEHILQSMNTSPESLCVFQASLRTIRFWAKQRGIYSSITGYLGGVSWAILTARICQLYPTMPPNFIVVAFFHSYSRWNWDLPLFLVSNRSITFDGTWVGESRHSAITVLTPSYPSINTTYSVSLSSLAVISGELKHAFQSITRQHFKCGQQMTSTIFDQYLISNNYKTYIRLVYGAAIDDRKLWFGFIESRLNAIMNDLTRRLGVGGRLQLFAEQGRACIGLGPKLLGGESPTTTTLVTIQEIIKSFLQFVRISFSHKKPGMYVIGRVICNNNRAN